jgi:8-oxo-dGTP diphosphatase
VVKQIHVVGAVIVREGLILCAQRGQEGSLPGLWEFPGGKVEPGESQQTALAREIAEELGCTVVVGEKVTTTSHDYEFGQVWLTTFYCRLADGEPSPSEHAALRWMGPDELLALEWAPADVPALHLIRSDFA